MKLKKTFVVVFIVLILLLMTSCVTQETIKERNQKIGESDAEGNYFEAQQVKEIETWKDTPGKIVNVYLINPVTGGLLVPPIQCKGVPVSSTESLEPNIGVPRGLAGYWVVPLDGVDVQTEEMAGRDGTFNDPVDFRQCMSIDGNYHDFPAMGLPYLVSSASYSFPEATVKRDFEAEARLMVAEDVLKRGGCIDVETLTEIECE